MTSCGHRFCYGHDLISEREDRLDLSGFPSGSLQCCLIWLDLNLFRPRKVYTSFLQILRTVFMLIPMKVLNAIADTIITEPTWA